MTSGQTEIEAPPEAPTPAEPVDVTKQTEVRKSLLKRRTGMSASWLTKNQLGGSDSKGL